MEDYEQKYEEALERAKTLHKLAIETSYENTRMAIEELFPELKENEDEIMVKSIIDFINHNGGGYPQEVKDKWIHWLELKKNNNITPWSEEDENKFKFLHHLLEQNLELHGSYGFSDIKELGYVTKQEALDMLISLKERMKGE